MREDLYSDEFMEEMLNEDIYIDDYEEDYYRPEEKEDEYEDYYEDEHEEIDSEHKHFSPKAEEDELSSEAKDLLPIGGSHDTRVHLINNAPEKEEDVSDMLPQYRKKTIHIEEDEEEEDGSFLGDFKEFILDWSGSGAIKKGILMFFVFLLITFYSMQPLLSAFYGGESTANPVKLLGNMFSDYILGGIVGVIIALMLSVGITILIYGNLRRQEKGYERSENDTYGDMRWAEEKDLKDAIKFTEKDRPEDMVLGLSHDYMHSLSMDIKRGNHNILVLGASGSGKDFTFLISNILVDIDRGNSFIVVGPPRGKKTSGPSTYELTSRLAQKTHEVRLLNLVKLEASDGWDMLGSIKALVGTNDAQTEVDNFVKTIMDNATGDDVKSDPYFDNIEKNLFTCLVSYVALSPNFRGEEHERHIGTCYDILVAMLANGGTFPIFDALPNDDPCKTAWKTFSGYGQKQKESAMSGLEAKIHVFQNEMIKEIFSHDEIDLSLPIKKPCAYYIETSVTNSTFQFVLSLFFTSIIQRMIKEASESEEDLDTKVNVYLNEFKSIGRISGFADKLANVRKYGVNLIVITQDVSQIETNYRGQKDTIMSNCDTWVVLGVNDNATAKLISDKVGMMTIVNKTTRVSRPKFNPLFIPLTEQSSTSDGKRLGINPDEVQRLRSTDESLIFVNSRFPYKARPYPYKNHYLAEYIDNPNNQHGSDRHVPAWQGEEKTADKKHTFKDPAIVDVPVKREGANDYPSKEPKRDKREKPKKDRVIKEDSKILSVDLFSVDED